MNDDTIRAKRWDAKYQEGICAGCNQLKKIVNAVRQLCDSCNHQRKRDAARREAEAESPTHELSRNQRDKIGQSRKTYCGWLNLMDKMDFSRAEKWAGKALARPHLVVIEADLTERGEFDLESEEDAVRMEDTDEDACPPSSSEKRKRDAEDNLMQALVEFGIPGGATHAVVNFVGEVLQSTSWGFPPAPEPEPLPPDHEGQTRTEDTPAKTEYPPSSNVELPADDGNSDDRDYKVITRPIVIEMPTAGTRRV